MDFLPCPHAGDITGDRRPCRHPGVLAPAGVTPELCAGCVYRTRAAGAPRPVDTRDPGGCAHRGREPVGEVDCPTCAGSVRLKLFPCAIHGRCTIATKTADLPACPCDRFEPTAQVPPEKLILSSGLSPGDIATMTTAVESLHATYPGRFLTDVRTPCPALWEHNPHVTPIPDDAPDTRTIALEYPSIHRSNQEPVSFVAGYTRYLGEQLGLKLEPTVNRPCLYLGDDEKRWVNQVCEHHTGGLDVPFWLVNAGVKNDFTAKQWPVESYQRVIDATHGRIQWVQVGESKHNHPALSGVIDLRGQTDLRQLVRLVWHARGGLGPVTLLQHLCAAWRKPYVCLVGGREPVPWVTYPHQHTLHTIGELNCCAVGGCWKSRVAPLGDGDDKDRSLCERPVFGLSRPVGECMARIQPAEVVAILERLVNRA